MDFYFNFRTLCSIYYFEPGAWISRLIIRKKFMNITISNTLRSVSIALAVLLLVAVSFAIAQKAQAADDELMGVWPDGTLEGDMGVWPDSYSDMGVWPDAYSYDTDSYGSGMGGFTGGWSFGGGGYGGGSGYSSVYAPTNTSVFAPTNTCTATNSCNTTTQINAPTNIVTNTTAAPSYPVYQPVYTQPAPVYTPPVYYPTQQPIAYNNTPYVTLAAVPYTGLELGFWGTIAYWGFLVLWCLIAAYLIVVKKIQNKIAAWFTGSSQNISSQKVLGSPSGSAQPDHFAQKYSAPKSQFAGIDSFVLSQINRA